jgi:hypothetical protein
MSNLTKDRSKGIRRLHAPPVFRPPPKEDIIPIIPPDS